MQNPEPITFSLAEPTDAVRIGGADGGIDITVTGGNGGFSYNWDAGIMPWKTLRACPRYLHRDCYRFKGCNESGIGRCGRSAAIQLDAIVSAPASCAGFADGPSRYPPVVARVRLSYAWDNGAGMAEYPQYFAAGTYTVTVTDANNCTYSEAVEVIEPAPLEATQLESTGASCNGFMDGWQSPSPYRRRRYPELQLGQRHRCGRRPIGLPAGIHHGYRYGCEWLYSGGRQ